MYVCSLYIISPSYNHTLHLIPSLLNCLTIILVITRGAKREGYCSRFSGLRESCNFCVIDERSVRMLKIQIPMLWGRNFVLYACVVHSWRFKFCKIDANRCNSHVECHARSTISANSANWSVLPLSWRLPQATTRLTYRRRNHGGSGGWSPPLIVAYSTLTFRVIFTLCFDILIVGNACMEPPLYKIIIPCTPMLIIKRQNT